MIGIGRCVLAHTRDDVADGEERIVVELFDGDGACPAFEDLQYFRAGIDLGDQIIRRRFDQSIEQCQRRSVVRDRRITARAMLSSDPRPAIM